ncbi:FXSXX-COOH protein [Catenuloplanes nepalensis]|uniref:FXSXX-COOH protein n=1 Tax=Catenuloplanes nepalensis TaxID=587533 RepID=A0ABT9N0X3_9ACTN|nr:hypothetical protein [Catenuloplanes nepalensis]MDP9797345.1 FXSXX-COOH protein [Catenuloplanes nepalensis]
MFDNSHEPLDEASMLKDVRGLPLDDLLAAGSADLDDALEQVLQGLSPTAENIAAFGSIP